MATRHQGAYQKGRLLWEGQDKPMRRVRERARVESERDAYVGHAAVLYDQTWLVLPAAAECDMTVWGVCLTLPMQPSWGNQEPGEQVASEVVEGMLNTAHATKPEEPAVSNDWDFVSDTAQVVKPFLNPILWTPYQP
ncbi:hypothetical protein L208DRAFT_1382986 [Tricholoma matsutake]|nr:hypothetical protein L208DRAFT_1382986 [Tricholoma matsutake 945]